jgi:hypothetical protein
MALVAARDANLIEDDQGALGDARGPFLRAGATADQTARRALVAFDFDGIPRGRTVTRATLILHQSANNTSPQTVTLHRVLEDWGEGGSRSTGGAGVPAAPGDATWLHRFHNAADPSDSPAWNGPGGSFAAHASASAEVAAPGYYQWTSVDLTRDVKLWIDQPRRNHGWLLLGNEAGLQSVKRFESRENEDPALRPVLLIEFGPAPPAKPVPPVTKLKR